LGWEFSIFLKDPTPKTLAEVFWLIYLNFYVPRSMKCPKISKFKSLDVAKKINHIKHFIISETQKLKLNLVCAGY